jgi:hypothetical protein
MANAENPYASPVVTVALTNCQLAMRRLRPPAIGLLACSLMMLAMMTMSFGSVAWMHVKGGFESVVETQLELWSTFWYAYTAMVCGSLLAAYASIQMLRARQYPACVTGAIFGTIPIITPCWVLGIPFGIWALVILLRKDTRAAFAEAKQ